MSDTNQHKRPLFEKFEQAREYAELTLNGAEGRDPWLPYEETWHFIADAYLGLLEQLEATRESVAIAKEMRDEHAQTIRDLSEQLKTAEKHLGAIAASYDPARAEESARVMYDIARSSVPQRDSQGRILDPEWAEQMIKRWQPSNPATSSEGGVLGHRAAADHRLASPSEVPDPATETLTEAARGSGLTSGNWRDASGAPAPNPGSSPASEPEAS